MGCRDCEVGRPGCLLQAGIVAPKRNIWRQACGTPKGKCEPLVRHRASPLETLNPWSRAAIHACATAQRIVGISLHIGRAGCYNFAPCVSAVRSVGASRCGRATPGDPSAPSVVSFWTLVPGRAKCTELRSRTWPPRQSYPQSRTAVLDRPLSRSRPW